MDDQKKTTVLNYITAISGEKVSTLLDLRNGRFYVQVLGLLDQWNKKDHLETDKDRLTCVQSFLQDYYGHDVKLDEFLNFDAILEAGNRCSESQIELELAKIAVVLLGIGVLDKNGQHFIGSAMKLPQEMHSDVMAILQSVVQAGSTEVLLTANIEKVLLEPSDLQNETNVVSLATWLQTSQSSVLLATEAEQSYLTRSPACLPDDNKSPPLSSLQQSYFVDTNQTSTPKEARFCTSSLAKASYLTDSPLRLNTSGLNYSLREITSPLRGLSIDIASPYSPLAQFVQSPQLLQKAIIKQKELEMRKLKQLLSDQIFLKDELQFNLQDKTTECANKDGEICKLQDRIKDLLHMRDSYDEFQDLKLRYVEMEMEMMRLNKMLQSFEQYKEECQLLEKESSAHCNEVEKLHQHIAAREAEANKYRDSLKTISDLESQTNSLQLQLDVMHKSKSDWDLERGALQGNLEMAKETVDKLRQEMDELLNKEQENAPGESMGVFMDIQIRELRCQLDELTQERELLLQQLQERNTTVTMKDCELDKLTQERELLLQQVQELSTTVTTKDCELDKLTQERELLLQQVQELSTTVTTKDCELDKLTQERELLLQQVQELSTTVTTKDCELDKLTQERELLLQQVQELSTTVTTKDCELDKLTQERELLLQQVQELSTTVTTKDCELDKLTSLLLEKNDMITKINATAQDQENIQCMLQEQLEVLKNEITAKETECLVRNSKVADLSERILLIENELQTQEHSFDALSEAKAILESGLSEKVNEVSSLRNDLSVQSEMLSQLQMDNNVTQGQLQCKEVELADLCRVFEKQKEEVEEIQQQLHSKSAAIDMLTEILNVKNADIINFQARELSAGEETKSLQITCEKLTDENGQYQEQLHSMESELQLVRDELTAKNAELSNVKTDVNCLKESLEEKSTMCRELGDLISQRSDELLKVQTEGEQMKNELILSENTVKELKESTQMKDEQLQTVHADKCRLEEQKQILNTAVHAKEVECTEHMNKVSCLTGTLADLRQELESQSRELVIVCETKSKLEEALNMQEEELNLAKNNISVKNETISKLEVERNNVQDDLRCREIEIEDLHREIAGQKEETANMKEQLTVKAAGLEELRAALNNTNTEVACFQKQKLSLDETICCLQATCEQLKIDNDKGKQLQSETEAELEHVRDEMTARNTQMSALISHHSDELIKTQREREQMKNELLHFENEVKELKESVHVKSEQLQTAQIIQCRLEEQLDSLNSQMQAKEDECLKHNEQVSHLTEQLTDLKSEMHSKQQDLNTLCEGKSSLEVELKMDKEQLESLRNDLLCKNETISRLETERNAVEERLKSKEVETEDLCLEIAKYKDEVAEVKDQLFTMSTTVDELTQTVQLRSTEITNLQTQRRTLDDALEHLTSDYEELKVKSEKCEQQLKSSEAECQQLRDQLAADGVQLLTLNAELDIIKKSEEEKTRVHREVQEFLSQRTDELIKTQDERDQAKEELNHCENEVKDLKEGMHQKNEQLEKMSNLRCQLEEQIKAMNNQIEDSDKKFSEHTEKVSILTEKVSNLQQERHLQSQNLSSLAEVKTKLEDDLNRQEEKVNKLQNDLTDQKKIICALETERDTAQEQIRSKTLDNEDLHQEIVKHKEEIREVKEQLMSKSTTLDEIMETLNLKNAEVLELQVQTISADEASYSLQVTCEKLKTENKYLAQQFSTSVAECLHVQDKLTGLQELVEEKSNFCKELEDVISQRSDELHKTQKDRDQIKNELEKHIELLKEQLTVKSVSVEELAATLNLKNVDINDKVQLLEDLTNTVTVKEAKISDLCLKLEESTNCISKLQEEISRTKQQIIQLTNTTQEQGKSVDELTVILQAKESAISEVNIELEKQISINKLKSNENTELRKQIRISTKEIEEQGAMIKSLKNLLEEKCDMLKTVNDELLGTEAVMLEKRDELVQVNYNLHTVQKQLICREEAVYSLETQLKQVNLTLQNTVDQLAKRDQIITEKDLAEQELNTRLSNVTSLLQQKVDEISTKNSVIENIQKEHTSKLAFVKQETESLKDKLDTRESEIIILTTQKTDLEAQITTSVLEHKAQLSELAEEHLKALSNAESHYQEITSTKEAEKLELEKQIAYVTGQYEAKIQAIDAEHETRLQQLCEDLKLEQQAQKQMEEGLIAQKERTERLESSMEQEKISHEKAACSILQEHDRKISVMEQTHASQVAMLISEKNKLLEEMENYKTKVSQLQENTLVLNEEHQQMIEKLQEQKAALEKDRQAFHKTLAARKEEFEKLEADKKVMWSQLTEAKDHIVHHERKIKTLQEENSSFLEREKKLLKESDSQMRTANEFCVSLRKQLETANTELESRNNEVKTLNEQFKRYEQQLSKMKETSTSLKNALKIERDTSLKMQKRMEGCTSKYEDMKRQYESMLKENKSYATEVNKMKTALDYSDRKLREYQHQLDQAGTALLGDASHFKQILEEKHYESLDDSLDGRNSSAISRTLRSSSRLSPGSFGRKTGLNETVSSDVSVLKRDTRASTTDIREKRLRQTEDRMSVCSTSSAHSIKSITSLTAVGLPNALSCADEPERTDYEWDRLSELQRRNTMYLPHMKSAYPVEMQTARKEKFTDDSLRLSLLPNKRGRVSPGEYMRQKELESKANKRKAAVKQTMEEVSGESPPKQIRTGPVYQRPGPPTPGKQPRRISGRFTPSHGISPMPGGKVKVLGSPIARPNHRRSCTPSRRTPRINSPMSPLATTINEENQESVTFNIGFTPKKSSAPKKLLRQKGFFSKDKAKDKDKSKATTAASETVVQLGKGKVVQKTGQINRKPLGARNYLETGI